MIWVFEGLNNDRPDITYFLEKYMERSPDVLFWDKDPSWYCDPKWEHEVQEAVNKYGSPDLVIGASMGGFGALLFQPIVKAKRCVIFGPQADSRHEILDTLPGDNFYWGKRMQKHIGKVIPENNNYNVEIYFGCNECDSYHRQLCIDLGYNVIDLPDCDIHCSFTYLFDNRKLEDILGKYAS